MTGIRELAAEIAAVLEESEGVGVSPYWERNGAWLQSNNDVTEFRFAITYDGHCFCISRVQLVEQRRGTMSRIFEACVKFCQENKIPKMWVQSALTLSIVDWCLKHKFELSPVSAIDTGTYRCGDFFLQVPGVSAQEFTRYYFE